MPIARFRSPAAWALAAALPVLFFAATAPAGPLPAGVQGPVRDRMTGETIAVKDAYDYEAADLRGGRVLWEDASGAPLAVVRDYGKGRVITTLVDWMVPRGNVPPEAKLYSDFLRPRDWAAEGA